MCIGDCPSDLSRQGDTLGFLQSGLRFRGRAGHNDHTVVITRLPVAGTPCPLSLFGGCNMRRREVKLDRSWQEFANCLGVDPDLFFPERGASTREAKEVCRGCVVRDDCLEYALRNSEKFGIWGGMSERERRRIRRQRAMARQEAAAAVAGPSASA